MSPQPLSRIVSRFKREPSRTGSLVITFHGDAILPRGGSVWLGTLLQFFELLGTDGGVVRTAVSRLAADGWLARDRIGRKSFYALARSGRERFEAAIAHVYDPHPQDWAGRFELLLIGNGASRKELSFLDQGPRRLVYSDLSPNAGQAIQKQFDFSPYQAVIRFAAIDAENLPFEDASFDVVYGHAMVHHLPDVERFLRGVKRVLVPGGRAVFMDDAFSPVWHYSKQTWLKPLMKYSHRKTGISPEDYRFSMSGGFKESELAAMMTGLGLQPFFQRACLLDYLWTRAAVKLLPRRLYPPLTTGLPMRALVRLDQAMTRLSWYRRNQIRLVWGFTKA